MDKLSRDSLRTLDFLAGVRRGAAQDAAAEMRRFVDRFATEGCGARPDVQSGLVVGFYQVCRACGSGAQGEGVVIV